MSRTRSGHRTHSEQFSWSRFKIMVMIILLHEQLRLSLWLGIGPRPSPEGRMLRSAQSRVLITTAGAGGSDVVTLASWYLCLNKMAWYAKPWNGVFPELLRRLPQNPQEASSECTFQSLDSGPLGPRLPPSPRLLVHPKSWSIAAPHICPHPSSCDYNRGGCHQVARELGLGFQL